MKYLLLSVSLLCIFSSSHAMQEIKEELKSPLSGTYVVVQKKEEITPEIQESQESRFDELPFFNEGHISELLQEKIIEEKKEPQAESAPAVAIHLSDLVDDLIEKHKIQLGVVVPLVGLLLITKLYLKLTQSEW